MTVREVLHRIAEAAFPVSRGRVESLESRVEELETRVEKIASRLTESIPHRVGDDL